MTHKDKIINANRTNESGQGLVEYALILVLIVILCVGAYYGGSALLKWYQSRNTSPTNTSAPTSAPAISSEGEIESIAQTGSTVEVIENETTTTNNCFSSNSTEIQTQRARSVEHLVVIEGQGGVTVGDVQLAQMPLLQVLKISLEGKYGVQDKQTEQRTYTIKFTTGANKWATHSVSWKYTWYIGEAKVKFPDGTEQIYTYKVRALLEPETISIEKDCSQMPSETPTVSP
jgi:Flp pilus assembly pilin Flp